MRDTVFAFSEPAARNQIEDSILSMEQAVRAYVPGYRLKQKVQFDLFEGENTLNIPRLGRLTGLKTSVFLEVEGAAHYLPAYAGNLDIMTSAALACAERMAATELAALAA